MVDTLATADLMESSTSEGPTWSSAWTDLELALPGSLDGVVGFAIERSLERYTEYRQRTECGRDAIETSRAFVLFIQSVEVIQ